MNHSSFVSAVLLSVSIAASSVSGAVIGSYVDNGNGTFTYSYQVDNSSGLFDVAAWSLEFGFAAPDWNPLGVPDGGDVTVPANWFADAGIPVAGASAQDFLSLDEGSDVLRGAQLGGFSFTSTRLPGSIGYAEFSAAGESATGTTFGPTTAVVPEVGSAYLIGLGALMVLALGQLRSRTTAGLAPASAIR
jgi:hypothetical protein